MNIEQANCIPMSEILERMERKAIKKGNSYDWYKSPFREEGTPSFRVEKKKNIWNDYGTGQGGDVVNLVCAYLTICNVSNTVSDALRWIKNMIGNDLAYADIKPVLWCELIEEKKTFDLISVNDLRHFGLKNYVTSRGISIIVAQQHLKEVRLLNNNTMKKIIALGLKNEENGYELRNAMFKSCIGRKSITFIRGTEPKPRGINMFEGMFDFLSVVTVNDKPLKNDSIVLNSTIMLNTAFPYLKGYGYEVLYDWMDNDATGKIATKEIASFCRSEEGLKHKPMQRFYADFNDVNACHMKNKLQL